MGNDFFFDDFCLGSLWSVCCTDVSTKTLIVYFSGISGGGIGVNNFWELPCPGSGKTV